MPGTWVNSIKVRNKQRLSAFPSGLLCFGSQAGGCCASLQAQVYAVHRGTLERCVMEALVPCWLRKAGKGAGFLKLIQPDAVVPSKACSDGISYQLSGLGDKLPGSFQP